MNDDRLLSELRSWLQSESVALPDAEQAGRDIRRQLPLTRPAGRRWRWARATDGPPGQVGATQGHTHMTRRTSSMFSPARIITLSLFTVAVGSALIVARPVQQGEEAVPAAESGVKPAGPVEFTATGSSGTCDVPATTSADGPVAHTRGASCSPTYSFSDSRLDGTVTLLSNDDEYVDGSGLVIQSVAMSIENEEGAWRMAPLLTVNAPGTFEFDPTRQVFLIGEGAYKGLVAVIDGFRTDRLHGFIIEGGLPPAPENAHTDGP
jgi:hypothetical protein